MIKNTIFISYRRGYGSGFAGRLRDKLSGLLPYAEIFMDVTEIRTGENFQQKLRQHLELSAMLIAVVGPDWNSIDQSTNAARLKNEDDYVRFELREAFRLGCKVIPVLVDDTSPPKKEHLPEDIEAICDVNAFNLRHDYFDSDFRNLVHEISGYFPRKERGFLRVYRPSKFVGSANDLFLSCVPPPFEGSSSGDLGTLYNGTIEKFVMEEGEYKLFLSNVQHERAIYGRGLSDFTGKTSTQVSDPLRIIVHADETTRVKVNYGMFSLSLSHG